MSPRIVITGIGVCSPIGHDPATVLESLKQGRSGIGSIRSFDASDFTMKHAGEIHDFDPYQHFSPEEVLEVDRATQMAVVAAERALASAKVKLSELPAERVAISAGMSGAGQFQNFRFTLAREYVISSGAGYFAARGVP